MIALLQTSQKIFVESAG